MQNNRVGRWCAGNGEKLKENGYERVRSEGHPGRNRGRTGWFSTDSPEKRKNEAWRMQREKSVPGILLQFLKFPVVRNCIA